MNSNKQDCLNYDKLDTDLRSELRMQVLQLVSLKCWSCYAIFIHINIIPIRQQIHLIETECYSEHNICLH